MFIEKQHVYNYLCFNNALLGNELLKWRDISDQPVTTLLPYHKNPTNTVNQTTWAPQLKECTKLQQKLSELNYQCIDTFAEIPKDIVNSEFFCTRKRDDTHYSRRTLVALAQATNNAIIKKLGIKTVKKHVFWVEKNENW